MEIIHVDWLQMNHFISGDATAILLKGMKAIPVGVDIRLEEVEDDGNLVDNGITVCPTCVALFHFYEFDENTANSLGFCTLLGLREHIFKKYKNVVSNSYFTVVYWD